MPRTEATRSYTAGWGPGRPGRWLRQIIRRAPAGQDPVQEAARAVPVTDLQAQQPARLERADQAVEHQFGVLDPLQQQGGLHDVEGALGQRHRPQVPERAPGQARLAAHARPG